MSHIEDSKFIFLGFVKTCGDIVLRSLLRNQELIQLEEELACDQELIGQKTL